MNAATLRRDPDDRGIWAGDVHLAWAQSGRVEDVEAGGVTYRTRQALVPVENDVAALPSRANSFPETFPRQVARLT